MKNLKTLLFVTSLLFIASFVNAQYLVNATEIYVRSASQVQTALNDFGFNTSPMSLNGIIDYKITYNTTDVFGNPTVASGALFVPQINCDTLPFVSYQHGTAYDKSDVPSNGSEFAVGLLYSGNRYITTLPDYLGMGDNPGIHPYIHWESEATASIDLIRAVREFLTDSLQIWDNNQLFLAGYSQGGHSTMAIHKYIKVNNLQSEFNVVASAPMSGPYALSSAELDFVFGSPTYPAPGYLPYAFASYQYVYGNLYTSYDEYYDPPYATTIAEWIAEGTNPPYLPTNFSAFMQDSVIDNILSMPNHPTRVALRDNDLYSWIPQDPVRMLYCTMDHLVTFENSIVALDTMNALGAADVQAIDVYPGGNHFTCFIPAHTYSLEWFDSLKVECDYVTSILPVTKQPKISLYPNPVEGIATFSSEKITSIEIYDLMGKLAISRNENKVDLSNMPAGIYYVIGFDKNSYPLYKGKIIKK